MDLIDGFGFIFKTLRFQWQVGNFFVTISTHTTDLISFESSFFERNFRIGYSGKNTGFFSWNMHWNLFFSMVKKLIN